MQHLSLFITFESPNIFTLDTEKIIIGQTYTSKTPDSSREGLIDASQRLQIHLAAAEQPVSSAAKLNQQILIASWEICH